MSSPNRLFHGPLRLKGFQTPFFIEFTDSIFHLHFRSHEFDIGSGKIKERIDPLQMLNKLNRMEEIDFIWESWPVFIFELVPY